METMIVYSGKSLNTIRQEGGLGDWVLSTVRAEACDYVVSCRNLREPFAAKDAPHGQAVFIAKVANVVPSVHASRCKIVFTEYAMLNIDEGWKLLTKGQRCPVGYCQTLDVFKLLKIDETTLTWKSLHESATVFPTSELVEAGASSVAAQPTTEFASLIAETKRSIAQKLGISINNVDIKITL